MLRRLLALLAFVAWLAAPAAGHAQSLDAALADLSSDDGDKREAAVGVIGATKDPRWTAFLAALRDGSVYARKTSQGVEVVVGSAKSTQGDRDVIEIKSAHDDSPLGTVPLADLTEVAADRRLRIAIRPFLEA